MFTELRTEGDDTAEWVEQLAVERNVAGEAFAEVGHHLIALMRIDLPDVDLPDVDLT